MAAHAAFDRGAAGDHTRAQRASPLARRATRALGGVALVRPDVIVQAIVDGVHLAPEAAYVAFLAARERFCLVTDAIEAAMLDAGEYELGGRPVRVRDGAVRLPDGTLAGSVLTMDEAVRNLVACGASTRGRGARGLERAGAAAGPRRPRRAAPGRARASHRARRRSCARRARSWAAWRPSRARRRDLAQPGGVSGSSPRRRASASASCCARTAAGSARSGSAAAGSEMRRPADRRAPWPASALLPSPARGRKRSRHTRAATRRSRPETGGSGLNAWP